MIDFKSCPRCGGDVLGRAPASGDPGLCINCGWREPVIPEDVMDQVEAHLGRQHIENAYKRDRPAKKLR
jgi:hypothetical protein